MTAVFISLLVIVTISFVSPLLAHLIPHQLIPEAVFLILLGMIFGPNILGAFSLSDEVEVLSEIGVAFLFLLAGYEVDQKDLKGRTGAWATLAWFLSFGLAALVVHWRGRVSIFSFEGVALAIAMTATALGTLLPILKDRKLLGTPVGRFVLAHGAIGEVMPILAMAILLSLRSTLTSVLLVAVFIALSVTIAFIQKTLHDLGARVVELIHFKSESTAQTTVRGTVVLLIALVTVAAAMGFDVVLGAFAAGYIIRHTIPEGRQELEQKLDGLAFGFFIPIFFVVSGAYLDPSAITDDPWGWLGFLALLIAVRGLPVFFATYLPVDSGNHKQMTLRQRLSAALYATTSLPIIVAVTHLAVAAGAMSTTTASKLVMAGTASVMLLPVLAELANHAPEPKNPAWPLPASKVRASRPPANKKRATTSNKISRSEGKTSKPAKQQSAKDKESAN